MMKSLLAGLFLPVGLMAHAAQPAPVHAPLPSQVIEVGQSVTGVLASGSQRSMTAQVPAAHVIQGTFTGRNVALDLVDTQGKHVRRLATGDGVAQSFMWVAVSATESLVVKDIGNDPGNFHVELTRSLKPLSAGDTIANSPVAAQPPATDGSRSTTSPQPVPITSPRLIALGNTLAEGGTTDAFWNEMQQRGTPLVEPLDDKQSLVTFLWRGARHNVKLFGAPSGNHESLIRLGNSDVWWRSFTVPSTSRLSYRLAPDVPTVQGNATDNRRMILATAQRDPLNPHIFPHSAATPIDGYQGSSTLELPEAAPQPWVQPRAGVKPGTLSRTRFTSKGLGNERDLWTYVPAGQAPEALLVLFDANEYLHRVPTPTIIDNLIADGLIPPTAVVLIGNASPAARGDELPPNETFATFLDQEFMPWVTKQGLVQPAARTVIAGSSYGGLASAYAGLTNAKWFGQVLSLSGSYWWGKTKGEPSWLTQQYAQSPVQDVSFYLDAGRYEVGRGDIPGILQTSRSFGDTLRAKGYRVTQVEHDTGHDYLHWQGSLACGLVALLNPEQGKIMPACQGT